MRRPSARRQGVDPMAEGSDAISKTMKESGRRIEAEHARSVAVAEKRRHELREQITANTREVERRWEIMRERSGRVDRENRTTAYPPKGNAS
jgi:predicted solute-binding protein